MHLFRFAFVAAVAIFASPVRAEDDKPAGEQFQFQADVNKLMVRARRRRQDPKAGARPDAGEPRVAPVGVRARPRCLS